MTTLLKRLWHHISPRRRGQFGLLLVLMLIASFAEILSLGAVLPFLAVLTAPESVFEHAAAQPVIHALRLTEPEQLVLPLTIAFSQSQRCHPQHCFARLDAHQWQCDADHDSYSLADN